MNAPNQQSATNHQQPRYQCRHIFTDGHRCASPSLRQENFCYFHHTTRRPVTAEATKDRRRTTARLSEFHLPLPEDRSAIQSAIGLILQRIASNDLDPKRAGLLLYGLQIASLNLPKQQQSNEDEPAVVEEITIHPELGTLAPQTEIKVKKSSAAILLEELRQQSRSNPTVLPQIQACEDAEKLRLADGPGFRTSPELSPGHNDRHCRRRRPALIFNGDAERLGLNALRQSRHDDVGIAARIRMKGPGRNRVASIGWNQP